MEYHVTEIFTEQNEDDRHRALARLLEAVSADAPA